MKKLTTLFISLLSASMMVFMVHANATAENFDIATILDKTQASGNLPGIIDDSGANRGAAFNGEHVFVASRQGEGNPFVYYWDVNEPDAEPGTLDVTGVSGGVFPLNDMTVVGNHIFVSNMVFADGQFKMYHWDGVDAEPDILIDYETPVRLGDAFTVMGDPEEHAIIAVSAFGASAFYVWEIENGALVDDDPEILEWEEIPSTNFSRLTGVVGSDEMLASGPAFGPVLVDEANEFVNNMPVDFFPGWPMYAHVIHFEDQRFFVYAHVGENPAENSLYILDMTQGETVSEAMDHLVDAGFENSVLHTASLGDEPNLNASVSVDAHFDEAGNLHLMAFAAGNGFIVQKIEEEEDEEPPVDHLDVATILDKTQASGNLPGMIDDSGANRGAAFNGEHVFVASRQGEGNPFVYYWDVNEPDAEPGTLDVTGISGGFFPVNDMTVVGNHIFVSNMDFADGQFKMYHWDGVDAEPTILIDYESPHRLGDAFSVMGDPDDHAIIAASAWGASAFYVWEIENGELVEDDPEILEWDEIESTSFSRITEVVGSDEMLVSGSGFGPVLVDADYEHVNDMPVEFFPGWPMYAHVIHFEDQRFFVYAHVNDDPAENSLYILDMNQGETVSEAMDHLVDAGFENSVLHTVSLGDEPNLNASVSVDAHVDEAGNLHLMAFAAGNGFIVQKIEAEEEDEEPPVDPIDVATILDKTQASGNMPDIIDDSGANRGAGFNGEHVFVASRQGEGNPFVYYWDVNEPGAEPGTLDVTGVSGGVFPLNDLTVVGNHIFVSNMVFADGQFKMYHWDGVDAEPNILIDYETPVRLGDAFTVMGDPEEHAIIAVSAFGASAFYVWEIENGELAEDDPEILEWEEIPSTNFSRLTGIVGSDEMLASGPAFGPVLVDEANEFVNDMPVDFFPGWPMYAHIIHFEDHRFFVYAHVGENPAENSLYILDMNQGETVSEAMDHLVDAGFDNSVLHTVSLGDEPNGNASVSVDAHFDEAGNLHLMAYAAGNGFIVQKIGEEVVEPDTYTVTFEVIDVDENPIEEAIVTLGEETNAPGDYVFEDVTEDTYDYMVEREGFLTVDGTLEVTDDMTVTVVLEEELDVEHLPFLEDFEAMGEDTPEDWIPDGWLNIDYNENGHKWYWADFTDDDTGEYEAYMLSRSWDGDNPIEPDSWLITPAIKLEEVQDGEIIELTYHVAPTANTPEFRTENYQVLISTTDADPESFTMIYEETLSEEDENWVWLERNLDLTEYAGDVIYLAIRHYDSPDNERIALERVMIDVVETFEVTFEIEDEEGNPIVDAIVTFDGHTYDPGHYVIEGVKEGTYDYTVDKEGYETVTETVEVNQDITVDVTLVEEAVETFEVHFHVDLSLAILYEVLVDFDPEVHHIMITGEMFDWTEPDPAHEDMVLEHVEGDTYAITLHLEEGVYEYKYFSDAIDDGWDGGEWPGGDNRIVEVTGDMTVEDYFGYTDDEVSVVDTDQISLNLYPNPARSTLYVEADANITEIRMIDVLGQVVYSKSLDGQRHAIQVGNFDTGLYFIQLTTEKGMHTHRIQVK